MVTTWNYPTAIRFGVGAIAELPEACRALGMQNPLFVTDPILATLDVTKSVLQILTDAGLNHGVFSDIEANPVGGDVDKGVAQLRSYDTMASLPLVAEQRSTWAKPSH